MEKSELEKYADRVNHVLESPDWESWRVFAEIQFRNQVYVALSSREPAARISAMDKAFAILELSKGFETEQAKCEKMLTFAKMDEDAAVNRRARESARVGGPQPYREE